jgi:Leucine-rich repeat (LRR) protein
MTSMTDSPLKPRRPWFRFSLRFLLLLVAVVAVPLAWKVNRARNQRLVVAEIERLNGHMYYDYERNFNVGLSTSVVPQPPGPNWLREFLGIDYFADIVHVNVRGPQVANDTLARIASLPHLQLLGVDSDRITDRGVAMVASSKELISFGVASKSVTVASIDHLQGLPNLQFLRCSGSQVNDSWIEHIARLKSLDTLALNHTQVTDQGLAGLTELGNLEGLFLEGTPITDAGLDQLHAMTKLKRIGLSDTKVTKAGVQRLQKALPNLQIR